MGMLVVWKWFQTVAMLVCRKTARYKSSNNLKINKIGGGGLGGEWTFKRDIRQREPLTFSCYSFKVKTSKYCFGIENSVPRGSRDLGIEIIIWFLWVLPVKMWAITSAADVGGSSDTAPRRDIKMSAWDKCSMQVGLPFPAWEMYDLGVVPGECTV